MNVSEQNPSPHDWVCAKCGGTNIQVMDWVDANTNAYVGVTENIETHDRWCDDCQEHTEHAARADYDYSANKEPA